MQWSAVNCSVVFTLQCNNSVQCLCYSALPLHCSVRKKERKKVYSTQWWCSVHVNMYYHCTALHSNVHVTALHHHYTAVYMLQCTSTAVHCGSSEAFSCPTLHVQSKAKLQNTAGIRSLFMASWVSSWHHYPHNGIIILIMASLSPSWHHNLHNGV